MKFIISLLLILLMISCNYRSTVNEKRVVKYEVTGTTRRVNIIFVDASGETEEFYKIKIPWERNIYPKNGYLYLSVQNARDDGSVTARIWVDGKIIKESTSSGAYVIVSVSDRLD